MTTMLWVAGVWAVLAGLSWALVHGGTREPSPELTECDRCPRKDCAGCELRAGTL